MIDLTVISGTIPDVKVRYIMHNRIKNKVRYPEIRRWTYADI